MEQIKLKEGQAVFQVGEQSKHVFLILTGSVGLFSPVDMTSPVTQLCQGDVFGETGLLKNQLRCSKALCLEDCEILRITKADFLRRFDGCDPLLKRLLNTMVSQSSRAERSTSQVGMSEAA
jgi:CRP-like cAMP-binding protein